MHKSPNLYVIDFLKNLWTDYCTRFLLTYITIFLFILEFPSEKNSTRTKSQVQASN